MQFETYEDFNGECCICEKKAETVYIKQGFFTLKFRRFCKDCAKKHRVIKKAH